MKSSALQAIVCVLLILFTPLFTQSQTGPTRKPATSSIRGKVTIKGKGAPGIIVVLRSAAFSGQQTARYKGTTDQDGNYQITNVAPGSYQVVPIAGAYVISGLGEPEGRGKSLIIAEGEAVDGIDFAMTRGGVITGRATDTEGRPLIEQQINVLPVSVNIEGRPVYFTLPRRSMTDDRGIYRIFGIPKGRYTVSVGGGQAGSFPGVRRTSQYKQTFHPGVTDASRATVIEVSEGSEATNLDIAVTAGSTLDTFAVSGRLVDGDNGQPLPNVRLGIQMTADGGNSTITFSGGASNKQGEFKLENLSPGKYTIFVESQPNSEIRADPVSFEVIDQDVTGLLIKTLHGASISGVIVLEGSDDKSALGRLNQLRLNTLVLTEGQGTSRSVNINRDGSFRVGGLQAGIADFWLSSPDGSPLKGFTITRVERDGVSELRGLEVKDGEQITGVRLAVNYGAGAIRGIVKAENGDLPPPSRFFVWLTSPGDDPSNPQRKYLPSSQLDSRGHFLMEGLAAGTYDVNVTVVTGLGTRSSAKQQVNVADGVVTEVTLTLDLKPKPNPGSP